MSTTTGPVSCTYSEVYQTRGVPMDHLAGFIDRAIAAGAPAGGRIRLDDEPRNVLLGITVTGTRISVAWAYHPETTEDPS